MGFQKSMATNHSGTHSPLFRPCGGLVEGQEQLWTTRWWRIWNNVLDKDSHPTWGGWGILKRSLGMPSTHSVSYNLLSNRSQSPSIGLTLDRRNWEREAFALEASAGSATQQEMLVGFCPSHLGICPKIESCPYGFYMIILMCLLDLGPRDFLSSLPALMSCFKTLLSQQNTSFDNSVTDTPIS